MTTQLKYMGGRSASFLTPGHPETGHQYRVGGRGDTIDVEDADVQFLLSFRWQGQPEYLIVSAGGVEPAYVPGGGIPGAEVAQAIFDSLPTEAAIPDVTEVNVTTAVEMVEAEGDLQNVLVMQAMEEAGPNRTTVQKAISKRIRELSGGEISNA